MLRKASHAGQHEPADLIRASGRHFGDGALDERTGFSARISVRATRARRHGRTDAALAPVATDAEHRDVPALAPAVPVLLAHDHADRVVIAVGRIRLYRPQHVRRV
jgi:hypothetical protein